MKKNIICIFILSILSACATPLNSIQKSELKNWEMKGIAVEEKSETTAAVLGILPGGGSFYVREYALGVANLLLWPISIIWDPISGANGAEAINYNLTKFYLENKTDDEIEELEDQLIAGKITKEEFSLGKRKIQRKYK